MLSATAIYKNQHWHQQCLIDEDHQRLSCTAYIADNAHSGIHANIRCYMVGASAHDDLQKHFVLRAGRNGIQPLKEYYNN